MTLLPFALLIAGAMLAYLLNHRAAVVLRAGGAQMHSNPGYHGLLAGLGVLIPVLTFTLLWMLLDGPVIERLVLAGLPAAVFEQGHNGAINLLLAEIKSLAAGRAFGEPEPWKQLAADRLNSLRAMSEVFLAAIIAIVSIAILLIRRMGL